MDNYKGSVEHFGIDFGTTNIAVAGLIVDKDRRMAFRVLYGEDGLPFPAMLAIKEDSPRARGYFGRVVKTQLGQLQEDGFTIFKSIKTDLGEDVQYTVGALKYTPVKIVQYLVYYIKKYLQEKSGRPVEISKATVAVPVDFTEKQRKELCEAFKSVGITVNKLVSESLAAYIRNRDAV